MHSVAPFPCSTDESDTPDTLFSPDINKDRFQSALRRLHTLFTVYTCTCPVPIPAPGLFVTHEIRTQCELYLPIADITNAFCHLYSAALTYPPILSSSPFHNAMSWADAFTALPAQFQSSASPAQLLEALLSDRSLLTAFLFASFLPDRFYGGIGRYPGQQQCIREWLEKRERNTLRCLDAACGTGEGTYGLALLLSEGGFPPGDVRIEGWTLEPLEVWAAARRRFPHDRSRETMLREATSALSEQGFLARIRFRCADLTGFPLNHSLTTVEAGGFDQCDLILCNGLLGGPIIHQKVQLDRAVGNLAQLLAPGGILLAADSFHGGWKQKCPQTELRALFEAKGMNVFDAGEGIGGLKPDQ